MAAKRSTKKKPADSPVAVRLRRLAAWMVGPGRTWTLAAAILLLATGITLHLWDWARDRVLASRSYQVQMEDLDITPLPAWVHADIRVDAYQDLTVDGPVSIMDDDLNQRVAEVFSLQPWVARVVQVRKYHPARVKVELEYRRPVCMVEVRTTDDGQTELLPVDARGVLLPTNSFIESLEKRIDASTLYPRLSGIDTQPMCGLGGPWRDARVVGGAEIAAAFGPAWLRLGLARIVPDTQSRSNRSGAEPTYSLLTRNSTRILWGHRPGAEGPGELPARQKIDWLHKYAARHGSLDRPGGPPVLDVRTVQTLRVATQSEATSR